MKNPRAIAIGSFSQRREMDIQKIRNSTSQRLPQPITSHAETVEESTLAQLIGGCGIAAIDGYIQTRDYAASKGIDLVELHHKGIDLQDLISTLVIHTQRMAETESRSKRRA